MAFPAQLSPLLPSTFQPNLDPSVTNSFATAAFRFGHTMLRSSNVLLALDSTAVLTQFQLRDSFNQLEPFYSRDGGRGVDQILKGALFQNSFEYDRFVVRDVTDFLFANDMPPGSDLVSRWVSENKI